MPKITGKLRDIGLDSLAGKNPVLEFSLNSPNAKDDGRLYTTNPVRVTPDSNGDFTVYLDATDSMVKDAWVKLTVKWAETGEKGETGYTRIDFPDFQIRVGDTTTSLGNAIERGANGNPMMVWVSLTAPPDPRPFDMWLKDNPEDPSDRRNTGNLYQFTNDV